MAKKIVKAVGGVVLGGALGSVFGGKKKAAPAAATPNPLMPDADSAAVALAKKRSITEQLARQGRSSTMLTADSETLGG